MSTLEFIDVERTENAPDPSNVTNTIGAGGDEAIAEALAYLTHRDLPVLAVRELLRERELWLKDPKTRARDLGTIGEAIEIMPDALFHALVILEAALYDESANTLSTSTRPDKALQVGQTIDGLLAMGLITANHRAEFYAIGGGLKYPDGVIDSDVVNARAAEVVRAAAAKQADRLENATTFFKERMTADGDAAAVWAQAWADAEAPA